MLATTTSNGAGSRTPQRTPARGDANVASTPLRPALARLAATACGSMSTPTTRAGAEPRRGDREDARAAAVVEHRLARARTFAASQRRHRRVVGCEPVPNARPGSSARLIAPGSSGSHHVGTIQRPSAIRIGANCACVARTQSCSATLEALVRRRGAPSRRAAARRAPRRDRRRRPNSARQPRHRPARRRRRRRARRRAASRRRAGARRRRRRPTARPPSSSASRPARRPSPASASKRSGERSSAPIGGLSPPRACAWRASPRGSG